MSHNNYIKILAYLNQFAGDSKLYNIEDFLKQLALGNKESKEILTELSTNGFINFDGGYKKAGGVTLYTRDRETKRNIKTFDSSYITDYIPFKAKITLKGSKYLKEELQMQESGKYTFNFHGSTNTNNIAIESKYVNFNNQNQVQGKIDEIISLISRDNNINPELQKEAIQVFEEVRTEAVSGKIQETLIDKMINYGDKISSIASFILSLISAIKAG